MAIIDSADTLQDSRNRKRMPRQISEICLDQFEHTLQLHVEIRDE